MSDKSKLNAALEIAQSQTQVFTTMNSNDALQALSDLSELFENRELMAMKVHGIISQKLVRKVCPMCAEKYRPKAELLELVGLKTYRRMFYSRKASDVPNVREQDILV